MLKMKTLIMEGLKLAGLTDLSFNDVVRPYYKKDENGKAEVKEGKLVTAGFTIGWQYSHLFDVNALQNALNNSGIDYYARPFKDSSKALLEYNTYNAECVAKGEECFPFAPPIGISKSLEFTETADDVFK